jgi:hypothetical protein
MMLIKLFAAACLGLAVMAGLQTAGIWALQQHLKSPQANAGMPKIGGPLDFSKTTSFRLPQYGMIDTREGQRLAVEGAARRIDLQIRAAQNAVPLPPRFHHGIPRR